MAATIAKVSQIAIDSIVHGPSGVVIYDVASIKWNTFANSLVGLLPRPSSLLCCVRLLLILFHLLHHLLVSHHLLSRPLYVFPHLILIILSVSLLHSLCREVETVPCDIPYLG